MAFTLGVPASPQINFDDYEDDRMAGFEFVVRLFVYISVLVIFLMVVALIVKLIGCFEDDDAAVPAGDGEINSTETSLLLPKEAAPAVIYGACEEDDDVESGNCSRSSSSEDFYDGKICVICYDRKRCCFFIPCGHCATCYQCAKRISEGEGKICPFCRTSIQRIRRLFTP